MITHRQIEAFKAVIEAGTVSAAGEALHLSQPSVSQLLSELEARLGYPLFERRKGRLTPRREAHELYAEVERSYSGLRRVEAVAARIGRKGGGRLRIATLPALAEDLLPRTARRLLADRPGIWMSVQIRPLDEVIEGVATQQFNLGLTTLPAEHADVETALVARLPFHCILHPGHPLAGRAALTLEDAADINFISVTGEGTSHPCGQIVRMFREAGIKYRVSMECTTMDFACGMVADGLGAVFAPSLCIDNRMRPHLRAIPFTPDIWVDIAVLYPKSRPSGILARRFIKAFTRVLHEQKRGLTVEPGELADVTV